METPETPFDLARVAHLVAFPKNMNTISGLELSDHIEDTGMIIKMQLKQSGSWISEN